jgi:hypothetical protein
MRGLIVILFFPMFAFAQDVRPYDVVMQPGDTPVKQGVIKVRKPSLRPYFKCEYYLTLSRVQEVEVLVPSPSGIPGDMERDLVPVFDSSAYGAANERVFPIKSGCFSRILVDEIQYAYPFSDSLSIDTLVVEMWIGKNGKIRWRNIDTAYGSTMPREFELELYQAVNGMTEWGKGGGYMTPKKFLRKQKKIAESYYCLLYIIASAKPLTNQQKTTGARYTPIDIPLNAPQEAPVEKREHAGDSLQNNETRK